MNRPAPFALDIAAACRWYFAAQMVRLKRFKRFTG
jgi:hypothetical protein